MLTGHTIQGGKGNKTKVKVIADSLNQQYEALIANFLMIQLLDMKKYPHQSVSTYPFHLKVQDSAGIINAFR